MTLTAVLTALANNAGVSITLMDAEGVVLITFMAPGYASIESDLGEKVVKRITVKSAKELTVTLEADTP